MQQKVSCDHQWLLIPLIAWHCVLPRLITNDILTRAVRHFVLQYHYRLYSVNALICVVYISSSFLRDIRFKFIIY